VDYGKLLSKQTTKSRYQVIGASVFVNAVETIAGRGAII
jgi:hypothetical protein